MKNKYLNLPLMITRDGEVWNQHEQIGSALDTTFLDKLDAEFHNSLGAEQTISTLTAVLPDIIKQQVYEVQNLGQYIDMKVGQGNPFAMETMRFASKIDASDFESGLSFMRSNVPDGQSDNISLEPIKIPVTTWTKYVNYNILENGVMSAATNGMVDYLSQEMSARKELYDLGILDATFWGLKSNPTDFQGLLTQSGVTVNTTAITKKLSEMTASELNAFVGSILELYRTNCARTAYPNVFIIPEDDYNGLPSQYSETIGGMTKMELLNKAFKDATGNANFKILSSAHAMASYNSAISGLNKNRYALYNKNPKSLVMDIPIDFTVTLPVPVDGINYRSAAYSRFATPRQLRTPEMLYLDRTPAST